MSWKKGQRKGEKQKRESEIGEHWTQNEKFVCIALQYTCIENMLHLGSVHLWLHSFQYACLSMWSS